jgi:hypothetical protein
VNYLGGEAPTATLNLSQILANDIEEACEYLEQHGGQRHRRSFMTRTKRQRSVEASLKTARPAERNFLFIFTRASYNWGRLAPACWCKHNLSSEAIFDIQVHKRRRKHEAKSTIKPTSETWIPEDGLYDHLLLKLAKK